MSEETLTPNQNQVPVQSQSNPTPSKSNNVLGYILLAVLGLLLLGGSACAGYWYGTQWETYSNVEYGYLIKYPQRFTTQIQAAEVGTVLFPANSGEFFIYDPKLEESYLNRYVSVTVLSAITKPVHGSAWEESETTINNLQATKMTSVYKASSFDIYYIDLGRDEGFIMIYASNTVDKKEVANQILSTFKFLD